MQVADYFLFFVYYAASTISVTLFAGESSCLFVMCNLIIEKGDLTSSAGLAGVETVASHVLRSSKDWFNVIA